MKKIVIICLFVLAPVFMASIVGRKSVRSQFNPKDIRASKKIRSNIAEIKLLHNMHVPWHVVISYHPGNEKVIQELYKIIDKINVAEKLDNENGYNRRMTFSVIMPSYYRDDNDKKIRFINQRKEFEKVKRKFFAKLSKIETERTPIHDIYISSGDVVWMQDILEIGALRLKGERMLHPGIFDLRYHHPDTSARTYIYLSKFFNMPGFSLNGTGAEHSESADTGGNIETTHEGVIYVGNKITQPLFEDLKRFTRQKIVELPTDWLHVGHVDEILFFIPAKNTCGAALVYANPLEALRLMLKRKMWIKPSYEDIKASVDYFLKKTSKKKMNFTIRDFDLLKKPRKKGNKFEKKFGNYADWIVVENLKAYKKIMQSIAILKKNSRCLKKLVSLPVFMEEPPDEPYHANEGVLTYNPLTNAVVLRDHVIVPKGEFDELAVERLEAVLGKNKVHLIDTSWYEQHQGAVHCATTVIRDPYRVIKLK